MKKRVWASVFGLALLLLLAWAFWPSRTLRVTIQDPQFVLYDIRYQAGTNRVYHWRSAGRDVLSFFGVNPTRVIPDEHGPALVIYYTLKRSSTTGPMLRRDDLKSAADRASGEYFGNKCLMRYFVQDFTNGTYHLSEFISPRLGWTNLADIEVKL